MALTKNDLNKLTKIVEKIIKENNRYLRSNFKSDIGDIRAEVKSDIGSLRSNFKSDIGDIRAEVKSDIGSLRSNFKSDIGDIRSDIKKEFEKNNNRLIAYFKAEIKLVHVRIDKLDESLNLKIDELRSGITRLENKIDDIKDMETEDIQMIWSEIKTLKQRVVSLEKTQK